MKLSDISALFNIFKTAPSRNSSGRGLFDEEEPIEELSPQHARAVLEVVLKYYKHKQGYFYMIDLFPLLEITGKDRAWLHREVMTRIADYRLVYDDTSSRYDIMI